MFIIGIELHLEFIKFNRLFWLWRTLYFMGKCCPNLCVITYVFFFNNLNQNRPERSVLRKTDLSGLFF